ncbi:u4/u6.u5 tri-snrnp-associated protein snu66 [Acrodontium crateriforme]|uniref:U4/u6.u5 tri-snrnp-associated protein snu66 n=1 Tax=Acrodontium crateriforme TaxID=150365 RepID=A0AAQ3RD25_9PEZI|nr:u4/u6.u5 tri-snrnp-associated protein snu66 [Acrodontium crateriforme]
MDAAAIEQMNKLRASLGLAPLPVPGNDAGPQFQNNKSGEQSGSEDDLSTLEKRQALSGANWQKLEDEKREKIERQKRKDAAKKARDAAQRFARLEGKGLGEADGEEELDTRTWLLQQKKRQKKIEKARKMEEELAAREEQAEYTAKDLAGVKVAHEVNEFDEITGEQILTLKDAEIGEDSEDDELENVDLRAKEKLDQKLKLKKRKPDYDPTEESEVGAVLSKYDEEIDGKKQKKFTLDGKGTAADAVQRRLAGDGESKGKGIKISLDMFKDDAPISDYVEPTTVKIKKPKKKKEKKTRQRSAGDDDTLGAPLIVAADTDAMELDGAQASKKRSFDFEDDEDLQAQLAESRRQALKKRKKTDAAELARQMREEMPIDEDIEEEGGLVIDETSEFVANLKKPEAPETRSSRSTNVTPPRNDDEGDDEDGDTEMAGGSYADAEERAERRSQREREAAEVPAEESTTTGLENEESLSGGVAASLAMLRKRGLIDQPASADLADKERKRTEFLASKQSLIDEFDRKAREQRETDRQSGRWSKMSNRDRDEYARQQNENREAYIARLLADKFNKEYRPDVKLEYHDEHGRSMNQKEAFKHMSHMFHGKGSGKQKTEKRLKKIEDEKKDMARGVLNVGDEGGMMNVQGREGKRQKQAGVRLQ